MAPLSTCHNFNLGVSINSGNSVSHQGLKALKALKKFHQAVMTIKPLNILLQSFHCEFETAHNHNNCNCNK